MEELALHGRRRALALHGALLGALLAFAPRPWYATYAGAGGDPVADQQLAGLLMWSLGAIAPIVAAFVLVAGWLERTTARPASPTRNLDLGLVED